MTDNYVSTIAMTIRQNVSPKLMPKGDVDLLFLFYAVLALTRGESATAKDVHDAWTAWMTARGEEHNSMVPFDQLPECVKDEDEPFLRAIRTVARKLGLTDV
jgi:hypothetical protein